MKTEAEIMKENELRELDRYLADHVMGWRRVDGTAKMSRLNDFSVHDKIWLFCGPGQSLATFSPATNSADAFMVLEKCANKTPVIQISYFGGLCGWVVSGRNSDAPIKAETISHAICLFAKALFSK